MFSHIQELSSDVMERSISTTVCKTLLVVMIRIVTNTFVFLCLIAGGVAIFYSVQVVSYNRNMCMLYTFVNQSLLSLYI